jgi:hypothetical protein
MNVFVDLVLKARGRNTGIDAIILGTILDSKKPTARVAPPL